ncbi:MAG: hypothetical protein RLZZ292_3743, partial [Bacteroidota bacterium]
MKINYQKTKFQLFSLALITLLLPMYLTAQSVAVTSEDVKCFGQSNGTITGQITGGTAPFSLILQDASNLAQVQTSTTATGAFTFSNVAKGTYRVKVTGASGPSFSSDNVEVTQPDALDFDAATSPTSKQVACGENTNLQVIVKSGSGTEPYNYQWSNNASTNSTVVPAENYMCIVTDANGCTISRSFSIQEPSTPQVTPTVTSININCKGDSTGEIKVTPPINANWTYSLNFNLVFTTKSVYSGLPAGGYTLQIRNNSDKCLINVTTFILTEPSESLN